MPLDDLGLSDQSWSQLMERIRQGKVTPFIGAAASYPTLPTGKRLASDWAAELPRYPGDRENLIAVAQYVSDMEGPKVPKVRVRDALLKALAEEPPPDFAAPDQPHALLAELPLPIYLTTNYDDFMFQALQAQGKDPIREVCRWNPDLRKHGDRSVFDERGFEPTADRPVVFHLHGILKKEESIVVSEDDYLNFMVDLSLHRNHLLPPRIQRALTGTSLMFMGYGLQDLNFKVIFQSLVIAMEPGLRKESVSLQLCKTEINERMYLAKSLENKNIEVIWGDLNQFVAGIRARLGPKLEVSTSA